MFCSIWHPQGVLVRRVEPTTDANKVLKEVWFTFCSFQNLMHLCCIFTFWNIHVIFIWILWELFYAKSKAAIKWEKSMAIICYNEETIIFGSIFDWNFIIQLIYPYQVWIVPVLSLFLHVIQLNIPVILQSFLVQQGNLSHW